MTIDELIAGAREYLEPRAADRRTRVLTANDIAQAVLDLLGESQPCGWPEPEVCAPDELTSTDRPYVWWEPLDTPDDPEGSRAALTPDEARSIAVMLLRAADEAEGAAK